MAALCGEILRKLDTVALRIPCPEALESFRVRPHQPLEKDPARSPRSLGRCGRPLGENPVDDGQVGGVLSGAAGGAGLVDAASASPGPPVQQTNLASEVEPEARITCALSKRGSL